MSESEFEEKLFIRYLNLLGIHKQSPSIEALKEIVKAQITKIPFENISKLFFKKHLNLTNLIDLELYLDGIEKYKFGGTCYANNFYLNQLLKWLGYDIRLCGADMKTRDVHILNIVNINNREFLIDTGYAAPFIEPIPLDLPNDYIITTIGNDHYILKPRINNNHSQIELYRNGVLKHGYSINPLARDIREFYQIIADSFNENATFMNALLLTRFDSDHFIIINNMTIIELSDIVSKVQSLGSLDELVEAINNRFGIPKMIVQESLSGLQMIRDAWN